MKIQQAIRAFVQDVLLTKTTDSFVYAEITPKEISVVAQYTNLELSGFEHIMEADNVRHIFKNHGNPKTEEKRGNIAITPQDFELLPEIVKNYDDIDVGEKSRFGNQRVIYSKVIGGTVYCVIEIRKQKKTLSLKTMYRTKKETQKSRE